MVGLNVAIVLEKSLWVGVEKSVVVSVADKVFVIIVDKELVCLVEIDPRAMHATKDRVAMKYVIAIFIIYCDLIALIIKEGEGGEINCVSVFVIEQRGTVEVTIEITMMFNDVIYISI